MSKQPVRFTTRIKGFVMSRLQVCLYGLAYAGLIPQSWAVKLISAFWENSADAIHAQWGSGTDDFDVVLSIIRRFHPKTVLDAGCGSGRLFKVYQQCGVRVTGVDVSAHALEIARCTYPDAELYQSRLEDLQYPSDTFDLGVCNRVLQHVPARHIQTVVSRLGQACRLVYVNELTQSDGIRELYFMKQYDYPKLFVELGFTCLETGQIGKQTYLVFGRLQSCGSIAEK